MPTTVTAAHHHKEPFPAASGDHLATPVRDLMTPGVVTICEDATLVHAYRAMVAHSVHAVLVIGRAEGRPLGWVTSRDLLAWVGYDQSLPCVREAITERARMIDPSATVREALRVLTQSGKSHLLVCKTADSIPEGVVSELDLVAFVGAS